MLWHRQWHHGTATALLARAHACLHPLLLVLGRGSLRGAATQQPPLECADRDRAEVGGIRVAGVGQRRRAQLRHHLGTAAAIGEQQHLQGSQPHRHAQVRDPQRLAQRLPHHRLLFRVIMRVAAGEPVGDGRALPFERRHIRAVMEGAQAVQ